MVGQQDAGNRTARAQIGRSRPWVWVEGSTARRRVRSYRDKQRQTREARGDHVASGQTPHPEKRVGEFEHNHNGAAIVCRGLFRQAVVSVFFVVVLRVVPPIVDFAERETVPVKVVPMVVVDQDRAHADRAQHHRRKEGQDEQQSRRTVDKQTHDTTILTGIPEYLLYRNAPIQPAIQLGILPRASLDIQVTLR